MRSGASSAPRANSRGAGRDASAADAPRRRGDRPPCRRGRGPGGPGSPGPRLRHRAGDAQLRSLRVHGDAVVGRVQEVQLAWHVFEVLGHRQPGDPPDAVALEVVLHEAVEEGDLEVDESLVRRQGHRAYRRAHAGISGLGQLLAHVDAAGHGAGSGVDDLEVPLALGGIQRRPVQRRVDETDAGVEDLAAAAGVDVLVRGVADGNRPTSSPVRTSRMCTTLPVEAETATRSPSGEIAMWSLRCPSTSKRQASSPVAMRIATTSARLGRETISSRPSPVVYMSSTCAPARPSVSTVVASG